MLYAIQPQALFVAQLMTLNLRNQGCSVVAAALGEAGAARASTRVLVLNEDFNRIDAGGVVSANRRADNHKLMGLRGTNTQMRLISEDERTNVQRGTRQRRNPVLFYLDQRLDCLNKVLNRQLRQAHTGIGVPHTLCVAVRTEQLNLSFRRAVCLHALERLHGIVQNHGSRIQLNRLIRHNARVMPADALGVVNNQHMIGIVITKSQIVLIRLRLFVRRRSKFDV